MRHRWIVKVLLQCALECALECAIAARSEEVFNTTPAPLVSNFSCYGRSMGFYADVEAECKVYYTCDDYGNRFVYRCPQETAFRQDALICDHAHLVECRKEDDHRAEGRPPGPPTTNPPRIPTLSLEPPNHHHHRPSSRSFHIVREPDDSSSASTHVRPPQGFVLGASLYLQDRSTTKSTSTASPPTKSLDRRPPTDPSLRRASFSSATPTHFPGDGRRASSQSNSRNADYYRYSETLRSIQENARETTTEIPLYALTMSLKPLVPNELEYDPYYPKMPTSTEAYYTAEHRDRGARPTFVRTSTPPTWRNVHFQLPSVLPDLNTLEDLVDRRKLFYIPRVKSG